MKSAKKIKKKKLEKLQTSSQGATRAATILITNWKKKKKTFTLSHFQSGSRLRNTMRDEGVSAGFLAFPGTPPHTLPTRPLIISLLGALSCGHCEDTTRRRSLIAVLVRGCRGENRYLDLFNYRSLLRWWIHALGGTASAGIQTTTQLGFSAAPENCTGGGRCCCSCSSPPSSSSSSVSVSTVSSTCAQEGSSILAGRHLVLLIHP